jgi:hypothetical protein
MPFIWILITWKGLDVLHGTRVFLIQKEWWQNYGRQTVVIIDPGIKIEEYFVYKEALKRLFCKRADGPT